MAILRQTPSCPFCEKPIATAVYRNQSDLPISMQIIGDSFVRWDYIECGCEGSMKAKEEFAAGFIGFSIETKKNEEK